MPIYQKTVSDGSTIDGVGSTLMMVHLGEFTLRDGSQYLHLKTDITSSSLMMFFYAWGYLYNNANIVGWMGGYAYTTTSILNAYSHNLGNVTFEGMYRVSTSPYNVCLRFNRGATSYTEGRINVFFGSHNLNTIPTIVAYSQNNTSGNYY